MAMRASVRRASGACGYSIWREHGVGSAYMPHSDHLTAERQAAQQQENILQRRGDRRSVLAHGSFLTV
eukprot:3611699-Prymnesium_polylepis.1